MKYKIGDKVYWHGDGRSCDPEKNIPSGYYIVKSISCYLPVVYVIGEGTEVFEWELS